MIKTPDLNEAAYLYTLGIIPLHIQRTDVTRAIFCYKTNKTTQECLDHYRTGMAKGCLSHFMYTRTILKSIIGSLPVDKLNPDAPVTGEFYYFIINDTIVRNCYGKEAIHYERWKSGNYYLFKRDAQKALGIKQ